MSQAAFLKHDRWLFLVNLTLYSQCYYVFCHVTCHFLLRMYFFILSFESFLAFMVLVSCFSQVCSKHWAQVSRALIRTNTQAHTHIHIYWLSWLYAFSVKTDIVSRMEVFSYFMSFLRRLVMKSLAFSEISSKASSSKSQVAEVTFDKVSLSLSPMKGDKPLSLRRRETQEEL